MTNSKTIFWEDLFCWCQLLRLNGSSTWELAFRIFLMFSQNYQPHLLKCCRNRHFFWFNGHSWLNFARKEAVIYQWFFPLVAFLWLMVPDWPMKFYHYIIHHSFCIITRVIWITELHRNAKLTIPLLNLNSHTWISAIGCHCLLTIQKNICLCWSTMVPQ